MLERLTLATSLSPDECVDRLVHTTSRWLASMQSSFPVATGSHSVKPVRGFVRGSRFYLGRRVNTRALLRTWIYGQIRRAERETVIEVSIGPNRVAGLFVTVLVAMLGAGAAIATVLAFISPFATWAGAVLSWSVVITFVAVFFVFPASDHPGERAFLLNHLQKTLEATQREARSATSDV